MLALFKTKMRTIETLFMFDVGLEVRPIYGSEVRVPYTQCVLGLRFVHSRVRSFYDAEIITLTCRIHAKVAEFNLDASHRGRIDG